MRWARKALEKFSRGKVITRKLPRDFDSAPIYVSPDAALGLWRYDLYKADPTLFNLVKRLVKPGDVVWDIGANVGLFAFSSAVLSKNKVFAIEPDTWLVEMMRRTVRDFNYPVSVIPLAVSNELRLSEFCVAERGRAANHLGNGSSQAGGTRYTETVPTVTLDWLATQIPVPNVIKIDVEGFEDKVLCSGVNLIHKYRPAIVCEVTSSNVDAVTEMLAGYKLYDGETMRPVERAVWSTVAI